MCCLWISNKVLMKKHFAASPAYVCQKLGEEQRVNILFHSANTRHADERLVSLLLPLVQTGSRERTGDAHVQSLPLSPPPCSCLLENLAFCLFRHSSWAPQGSAGKVTVCTNRAFKFIKFIGFFTNEWTQFSTNFLIMQICKISNLGQLGSSTVPNSPV